MTTDSSNMDLHNVLFLCGRRTNASVQIRCLDIASHLGCDYLTGARSAQEIPERYLAFVCVKQSFPPGELEKLSRRGIVLWDIIDTPPPETGVAVYLASTKFARDLFLHYGRIELIPHHHCNFEGTPNPPELRRPAWVGAPHWLPDLPGIEHDTCLVQRIGQAEVVQAFKRTGIGLNLRNREAYFKEAWSRRKPFLGTARERRRLEQDMFDFHLAVNSGIKLINCIGFGIPSVSSDEPAYREIGPDCTIFSTPRRCAHWVRELQNDDKLYFSLRQRCLQKAQEYHIGAIAGKYRNLIDSL